MGCVHCGKPASKEYDLVFDHGPDSRELTLSLCPQCLEEFRASADVRLISEC